MSRLFTELTKEVQEQQNARRKHEETQEQQPIDIDVETSDTDVGIRHQPEGLDHDKLRTVISELSEIKVSTYGTPVRLSASERRDIEDFIYITLRKKGLDSKAISSAKLMRFALRYLMKVHEREFIEALVEALKKEERLSI